jgi:hypothetical protein
VVLEGVLKPLTGAFYGSSIDQAAWVKLNASSFLT